MKFLRSDPGEFFSHNGSDPVWAGQNRPAHVVLIEAQCGPN